MTSLRTSTNWLHPRRQGVNPLVTPDTPNLAPKFVWHKFFCTPKFVLPPNCFPLWPTKCSPHQFFDPQKLITHKICWSPKILEPKMFDTKKCMDPTNYWPPKLNDPNNLWNPKLGNPSNLLTSKPFWLCSKTFLKRVTQRRTDKALYIYRYESYLVTFYDNKT